MATADGTFQYKERFGDQMARTYFRRVGDCAVSSIGLGTYLGEPTDDVDDAYQESLQTALDSGCNIIDTAINYRHQRSERTVGRALSDADAAREAVFLATKGGFVAFDGERPEHPGTYVEETYVDTGIASREDFAHGSHCITADYIGTQLDQSLSNLGVDSIDLYYVHNPETQLDIRSAEELYAQLEETFELLERRVAAGDISNYGIATWDAFRVPRGHEHHLDLSELVSRARTASKSAGNTVTHLRAIQLPFNVYMADAFTQSSQSGPEGDQSVLWFANEAGLNVFASASLAQGEVLNGVPDEVDVELSGETPAQRGLNFVRSAPGVTCALAGTTNPGHATENIAAGEFEPLGASAFDAVFE